jgi:hypothetical protein
MHWTKALAHCAGQGEPMMLGYEVDDPSPSSTAGVWSLIKIDEVLPWCPRQLSLPCSLHMQ